MTDFRIATLDELRPMVQALASLEWPTSKETISHVAESLGWELIGERRKGLAFSTSLGFNVDLVNILTPNDELTQATVGVTDSLRNAPAGGGDEQLRRAYDSVRDAVSEIIGEAPSKSRGRKRDFWDLPSGGRLAVENLGDQVILELLSQQYANIERGEAQQGLDPQVPLDDHQESQA